MTSVNHSNNFCLATLHFPSSTPPSSSAASPSSPSSTGWTDRITEKIQELKNKEESLKNLKEAKNGYLTEQDSKSLDSLPTQVASLETVSKLAEFADQLDTKNNNDNNNILNNLCTGLQTFLGFNPTSKGYNGTGIVYSDLDRLCDGVMGFLSGVLDAVKDDDAVKTYDKHLEKPLEKVLEEVNKNIGSGRAGLVESVGAVKGWLEGYEMKRSEKTENVIKRVKDLMRRINYQKENFWSPENKNLETQLKSWNDAIGRISEHMDETESDHISRLDEGLKNKVDSEWRRIKTAVDVMKRFSGDDDLKTLNEVARRQLEELEMTLSNKIAEHLIRVREKLQTTFQTDFQTPISNVNEALKRVKKDLSDWIFRAHWAVRRAMANVNAIVKVLEGREEQTEEEIRRQTPKKKIAVENAAKKLQDDANKLWTAVTQAKQGLSGLAGNIRVKVTALEKVYKDILKNLQSTVQGKVSAAQGVLGELDGKVVQDLGSSAFQEPIKSEIKKVIEAFQHGIRRIGDDGRTGDARSFIQQFYYQVNKDDAPQMYGWVEKAKDNSLYSPLEILRDSFRSRQFTTFKAFLAQFPDLKEEIGSTEKTFFEAVIHDLHKQLNGAIDSIKRNLSAKMLNYHSYAKQSEGGTIYSAIGQVRNDVDDYFEKGADGDIKESKLNENGYKDDTGNGKKKDLDDEINLIQSKGYEILDEAYESDTLNRKKIDGSTFSSQFSVFEASLHAFIKAVEELVKDGMLNQRDGKSSVNHYLEDLYKMIEGKEDGNVAFTSDMKDNVQGLKKIEQDILGILESNRAGNLKSIIENASNFYNKIQQDVDNCIGLLKSDVQEQVQFATTKIMQEAQRLYAQRKKLELNELRKLIENQKPAIENIINVDKVTGLKGFLNKMKDYFVKRIHEHMSPQQSPPPALKPAVDQSSEKTLAEVAESLNYAFKAFLMHLQKQSDFTSDFEKIRPSTTALHTLLETLVGSKHFDYKVKENLEKLDYLLRCLIPHTFGEGHAPSILEALRKGLPEMVKELDKAYVSRYSGQRITWTEEADGKETLTRNATKCGKVLLSVLPMFGELMRINQECMSKEWYKKVIFRRNANNPVAKFFEESGYSIPSSDTKQEGDLRCGITTLGIADRLSKESKLCTYMGGDDGTLKILCDSLKRYNQVCHLTLHSKPIHPCSVFEMLVWLTSLSYNSVYLDLTSAGFSDLFDKPQKKDADDKKKDSEEDEPMVTDLNAQTLAAYPRNVTYGGIQDAITHITHKAHELLVTIVGTGDASTIYSCDLLNNSLGFKYPTTAADCLQMLIDVLCALLPSLRYLERQCSLANQHSGWAKCFYGKGVKSSKWPCTDHSSDKASCQPNTKPNCQPSSPLMSYLNDCLPGHMPHRLQSVGCKAECKTCPTGQLGMPCITPLGFKAFSGSIKTGKDLCNIIREFLEHEYICGLLSLMPKPPSTLPQHFGFMLSMVRGWASSAKLGKERYSKRSFQCHFESSIADQSIWLYSDPSELTKAFTNAYGSQSVMHETCKYPHLVNLTGAEICRNATKDVDCSPYLMSLCDDSYYYVGYKHAGAYLSWAVYLPWTFWRYLNSLYNEFCNISCNDWGCSKCMHGDMCKPGKHGHVDEKTLKSHCQCPSIVGCRGVASTLYKFGFTFEDAKYLDRISTKSCSTFCTLLKSILHSQYFTNLFKECDKFLFTIRQPFIWLNVALWSLSLFYLLCVMVGRLDVLHIRSHLRIPSSHRITAQSLLAAAQVGRLAKISYLQP